MGKAASVQTDIVIIGGGVAGLWLLNRLRGLGFSAILLEAAQLGSGQSSKSQGIIHGGMKYALQGSITAATQAIMTMPQCWDDCLSGHGVIDLSRVKVLSRYQYLWSMNKLSSKLGGFFASVMLKGHVQALEKTAYPAIFQDSHFKGQVYSLKETVIDANAMIRELAQPHLQSIFKIESLTANNLQFNAAGELDFITINAPTPIQLKAQRYIFTAGLGNAMLTDYCNGALKMQRRPLHMVVMKTDLPYSLYGHCLGLSAVPRVTITTHQAQDGKSIWYLGGQLAEEGVCRDSQQQIKAAQKEIKKLFPWLDFSKAEFATFKIDRAEALQPDGKRPDSCYVKAFVNILAAWPTKLAFAPKLADEVIDLIQQQGIAPAAFDVSALSECVAPSFALPIWDELFTCN